MKLVFVYWGYENAGSMLDLRGYARAAQAMGHEVTIYGPANPVFALNYSQDLAGADAVIFVVEWTTDLQYGDRLDWARLVTSVPRQRRVVIDCDGAYNEPILFHGDYNHRTEESSRKWRDICDSLSDKICQPTLHPLRPNVRPFLFYAYNPTWEVPLDFRAKEYDMLYIGHCKFRWHPMCRVLRAIELVREEVGRVGLVGVGWDSLPWWAAPMQLEDSYLSDPAYLRKLGVEVLPPVPFEQVISWMSKAVFNPVISRPTFTYFQFVTPRMFETPAANTIPLLGLDDAHIEEIYGQPALELALPADNPQEKILDMVRRPEYYLDVLTQVRRHLAEKHSHAARLQELIEIIES